MKRIINKLRLLSIDWDKHPFLYGMFSLGDIGGNNRLFNETSKSDAELLREDWRQIGNDMRNAILRFETTTIK